MKHFSAIIIFSVIATSIFGQTLYQAKKWFRAGEYEKALPVFEKEIAEGSKNVSINFWYGACLVKTDSFYLALPYLKYAMTRKIEDAPYYIAEYFLKDRNIDSCYYYTDLYKKNVSKNRVKYQKAKKLKNKAEEIFKEYYKYVEDVTITDSLIIPKKDLYKRIKISGAAGIILYNKNIKDSSDLNSFSYMPQKKNIKLYSQQDYGNKLDIFKANRFNGKWDNGKSLPEPVNTKDNEINPFVLQDGITMYFASDKDSHNGTFDLYITRYNPTEDAYLTPDKLSMPFNSTGNDYFYIIDEFANKGYFASDRNNSKDFVTIYTFIPGEGIKMVKGKSFNELVNLAKIKSIKDTWEGKNIDSLIKETKNPVQEKRVKEKKKESFYINKRLTYHDVSDFLSKTAKGYYISYMALKKEANKKEKILKEKRNSYILATSEKKLDIAIKILAEEKALRNMQKQISFLETEIRNEEIKELEK